MSKVTSFLKRLCAEPPFRLISRAVIKRFGSSQYTKARWDAVERPHYLMGVLRAVDQAKRQNVSEIAVAEFGVAAGDGLLLLQQYAHDVEQETGVRIWVYGFDTGSGLPELCGDYRDHPDFYRIGDYHSDTDGLRKRLSERTELIIGNIRETIGPFIEHNQKAALGFAAIDVDFYSSTRDALTIVSHPKRKILHRVVLYFDELDLDFFHEYAGEFLAIREFNQTCDQVKIDKCHGVARLRPFPENHRLLGMYIAHDLEAISEVKLTRSSIVRAT